MSTSVLIRRTPASATPAQTAPGSSEPTTLPAAAPVTPPLTWPDGWPFSVTTHGNDVTVIFSAHMHALPLLLETRSHDWVASLGSRRLTIDFSSITQVSSPLAAWLGMIASYGVPITLCHLQPRVAVQLRMLRLDRLFTQSES